MKERQAPKRNSKTLIATAVVAAVTLGYVFFVFLPKQETIAEIRRELDEKQQFQLQVGPLVYSIQTADEELTLANDYSQQWESRSPSAATLAEFYEQLSAAGDDAGVKIIRFDPQPIEKMNRICQLPIGMAVEGTFEQIVQFLARIESLETTMWFESLAIERLANRPLMSEAGASATPDQPQSRRVLVQCQMTMKIFADKSKFSD